MAAGQRGNRKLKDFCGQRARRTSAEQAYKAHCAEIAGPAQPVSLRRREAFNHFRIWVAPRSRYALVPKQWDGSIFLWICKANLHAPVVGGDAGHSRSRRRRVTDVGLPLAGTHRPGRMDCFFGNLRQIRSCPAGRQSRRPLQRPALAPVGADDSVRPQNIPILR